MGIKIPNGLTDGGGQRQIFGRHIVQRPMRFEVLHRKPCRPGKAIKRPQLIKGVAVGFLRGDLDGSASKPQKIGKSRMGSHPDPRLFCQLHRMPQHHRITAMPAAGNIGGGNMGDHRFIHPNAVVAKALPQITVQIHPFHGLVLLSVVLSSL